MQRLARPVISWLKKQWVRLAWYVDDILLVGDSLDEITRSVSLTVTTLGMLGLRINDKKSCLEPTQTIEYLGLILDFVEQQ